MVVQGVWYNALIMFLLKQDHAGRVQNVRQDVGKKAFNSYILMHISYHAEILTGVLSRISRLEEKPFTKATSKGVGLFLGVFLLLEIELEGGVLILGKTTNCNLGRGGKHVSSYNSWKFRCCKVTTGGF